MAQVLLDNFVTTEQISCSGGPPQPGDMARLYLNQVANPAFPEFIDAVIQFPIEETSSVVGSCLTPIYNYSFIYDSDDLFGLNVTIQPYDVLTVECITCCTVLGIAIDEEVARATAAEQSEEDARIASDEALAEDIEDEATARTSAIAAETASRISADGTLTSAITTETTNRTTADTTLQTNINSEAAARIAADNLKQNKVRTPGYADDAAADADATLLSGELYYITGTRAVLRKP